MSTPLRKHTVVSAGSPGQDRLFAGITLAAGLLILLLLAGVAGFLLWQTRGLFGAPAAQFTGGRGFGAYIAPLVAGTLASAVMALLLATPVGIGVALFVSHYAPACLSRLVGYAIDLLAAIPSVVFGAWGASVLAPEAVAFYQWLWARLGWIPLFAGPPSSTGKTILTAGVVLAIMVLPIITTMCREIFVRTPVLHQEAALGLGATRWEMIRMTVLPFARAGVVSSVMLGLGRALGETMAVTLLLSPGPFGLSLIQSGNQTVASEIALNFPEAYGFRLEELIGAGLVLFLITLVVNMLARVVVTRYQQKAMDQP